MSSLWFAGGSRLIVGSIQGFFAAQNRHVRNQLPTGLHLVCFQLASFAAQRLQVYGIIKQLTANTSFPLACVGTHT